MVNRLRLFHFVVTVSALCLWKREIENELDHRSLRIRIFSYAICPENVIAASVVVKSAMKNAGHGNMSYTSSLILGRCRILLLDDDVVVQKDLTGHWEIDMDRKVNGGCRDLCRFVPLLERGKLLNVDPYLG
ncbi:hypothetical protein HID58_037133 [Brassica napus]|uniref:Hexosyltransferase n=1 Tax=Brassica napus TaxID=3708 RepID=A0ABQ7XFX0_BRANA|nr:hypothetical protein HID58_037133 [Brassica napus]